MLDEKEILAEGYKALSGRAWHASDCATSCAPAYRPGPCDCDGPLVSSLLGQVCDALETAICLIEDAEKDTNWVSGDPYGDSATVELRAVLVTGRAASAIEAGTGETGTGSIGEADESAIRASGDAQGTRP